MGTAHCADRLIRQALFTQDFVPVKLR